MSRNSLVYDHAVAQPTAWAPESLADDLVGLVAGVIEHRRFHSAAYGGFACTEDQCDELARAVASHVLATYELKRIP